MQRQSCLPDIVVPREVVDGKTLVGGEYALESSEVRLVPDGV